MVLRNSWSTHAILDALPGEFGSDDEEVIPRTWVLPGYYHTTRDARFRSDGKEEGMVIFLLASDGNYGRLGVGTFKVETDGTLSVAIGELSASSVITLV